MEDITSDTENYTLSGSTPKTSC